MREKNSRVGSRFLTWDQVQGSRDKVQGGEVMER